MENASLEESEAKTDGWTDLRKPVRTLFGKRMPLLRRRNPPPQLCATPEGKGDTDDDAEPSTPPAMDLKEPTAETESTVDALKRIFVGTEFGIQVAALTLAFVAFITWSTTALNDDFWLTPF